MILSSRSSLYSYYKLINCYSLRESRRASIE
jgi:hypothetical protein